MKVVGFMLNNKQDKSLNKIIKKLGISKYKFVKEIILKEINKFEKSLGGIYMGVNAEKKPIPTSTEKITSGKYTFKIPKVPPISEQKNEIKEEIGKIGEVLGDINMGVITDLLSKKSFTGIGVKDWVERKIEKLGDPPEIASFKRIFPQLSEKEISQIIKYYKDKKISKNE